MKKRFLVMIAMVATVIAISTGCTSPITSKLSIESKSTNMIFENPRTGEVEFVDLED